MAAARAIGAVSYGMYMLHMFAIHGGDVVLSRMNLMYPMCRFAVSAVGSVRVGGNQLSLL